MSSQLPSEFSDLLTPKGRRLISGQGSDGGAELTGILAREGRRFIGLEGLIEPRWCRTVLRALEDTLLPHLKPMDEPIAPQALWGMTRNYSEQLPKSVRVLTAMLESRRARAYSVAQEMGLVALLKSESLRAFAARLNGRRLQKRNGVQVLCYRSGDYSGPHNDHHPEDAQAKDGYLDFHLTFCTAAVAHQFLVYEKRGHLSELYPVNTLGGVTAYRLPFWHYTTPLQAKPRQEKKARRWLLLATFLDEKSGAVSK